MRNVFFLFAIVLLKIIYSDKTFKSDYNLLRYLQTGDTQGTNDVSTNSNTSGTNDTTIDSNTISPSDSNQNNNSTNNDTPIDTNPTDNSTNNPTDENKPPVNDTSIDNSTDPNSNNSTIPINTNNTNTTSNEQNPKSNFEYLLKNYNSWNEFFENIKYDNSFKYISTTQTTSTQDETPTPLPNETTNSTNVTAPPSATGKQQKTKYKSKVGSFLDDFLNKNLKLNMSVIPKTAKLRMAISIATPGVYRPESDLMGRYNNGTADIQGLMQPRDIFEMSWDPRRNINENGLKYAEKFANMTTKLYSKLGLTNFTSINETDFITVDSNVTLLYTQNMLQNFFTKLKNSIIESTDYTDDKFERFAFTNKVGNKLIGNLLKDYNDVYFGFGYKKCPKFLAWIKRSEKSEFLMTIYRKRFNNTLTALANHFINKTDYFLNSDIKYLTINKDQIFKNFTLASILVDAFYSNLVKSMGDEASLSKLYEIIPKDIIESEFFNLKKFLTYEIILYSHMHTYLMVSPFYEKMFAEFNKAIKDSNYTRKYLQYTANEEVLAALFKLFYFKSPDYIITRDTNQLKEEDMLLKDMLYQNCPFLDFGYSVAFELWENQERSQKVYYIGFRQNNNDALTFFMSGENFIEAMKLFYLDPTMTSNERRFWCRS